MAKVRRMTMGCRWEVIREGNKVEFGYPPGSLDRKVISLKRARQLVKRLEKRWTLKDGCVLRWDGHEVPVGGVYWNSRRNIRRLVDFIRKP